MRNWNIGHEELRLRLNEAFARHALHCSAALGPDGGVAVRRGNWLIGVWIEKRRQRFCFFPAAREAIELLDLTMDDAVTATLELADRPSQIGGPVPSTPLQLPAELRRLLALSQETRHGGDTSRP